MTKQKDDVVEVELDPTVAAVMTLDDECAALVARALISYQGEVSHLEEVCKMSIRTNFAEEYTRQRILLGQLLDELQDQMYPVG